MSDQPYQGHQGHQGHQGQGYDGYDPYQQPAPQAWPGQQTHDDPQAAQQYTQQWQGQTWQTQVHTPVTSGSAAPAGAAASAETSYLPSQGAGDAAAYQSGGWDGVPQGQAHAQAQPHAQFQSQAPFPSPTQQQSSGTDAQPADGEDPGYGPATLSGNSRVTDAQRARLEGRSPIIEPGMQPAALTALLGLLLSGAAAVGPYALVVPLVVLQAVTAAGWFRLNGMWPARQGIALAFAGAVTADVALLVADRAPAAILGTLGVWVLLALVLQLRSHADPDERMYGLMATVASAALAIIAAGYLAAEADAVTVGAMAVAVGVLARALPLPTVASVAVSLLAAAGAGVAGGAMTGVGAGGALLGAGAAVCALIGHRVASYDYPSRFVHFTAGVALPLAAAAPAVYVLGRALA
ncbi:hypothetical protein [Streptomyces sp. AS02]|uniref:hypothetical protein n=1 Tax=Streptomyces sp. AS02 TaxID=2938946 RepID=UPI0020212D8B|nr:hypothetical protein [Streptomyces sp. AS02]MCL8017469.1 hypothetical protein [Streptomyces sp. AS02]